MVFKATVCLDSIEIVLFYFIFVREEKKVSFVEKFENKFIIYLLIRCHKRYSLAYFMAFERYLFICVYRLNYRGLSPARSFVFIRGLVSSSFLSFRRRRRHLRRWSSSSFLHKLYFIDKKPKKIFSSSMYTPKRITSWLSQTFMMKL